MQIRPATVRDIPAILEIERACATAAHWSEQQYRHAIGAAQDFARRVVLIISQDGGDSRPCAFLVAHHIASEWELENVVVAPLARRRGLGKQLLNALIAEARLRNSEFIFLEVRESNVAARSLYELASFEQEGRRQAYYASPIEDAILYRLDLRRIASMSPFSF
jgi:ribosomal-protein-alanine N-acetyltransferase